MKDRCGYSMEVGQTADVFIGGVVHGTILEIREGGTANLSGQIQPGYVLMNVVVPLRMKPGDPCPVYVIGDAPKPEEKIRLVERPN